MTLKDLLDVANAGYPDQYLSNNYNEDGTFREGGYDGVARAIVIEIIETYDPGATSQDQLKEAVRVTGQVAEDAINVQSSLRDMLHEAETRRRTDWRPGD